MSDFAGQRQGKPVTRPRVSFVAAWQGSPTELSRRLQSWGRWVDEGIDVLLVCACSDADQQHIERSHRGVRVIRASRSAELGALRQLGISAAHGDIVVIVDDTLGWSPSWRDELPCAIRADFQFDALATSVDYGRLPRAAAETLPR